MLVEPFCSLLGVRFNLFGILLLAFYLNIANYLFLWHFKRIVLPLLDSNERGDGQHDSE